MSDRITLYYREGSSDKVYQAAIEPANGQFIVTFAYGRRGTMLTGGAKTTRPVGYEEARKLFEKLVREKKAKGYTEGVDGTPYAHSEKRVSGILPQLLNPVEETDVEKLLRDDYYCAQEKFDGRHLLIRKRDDCIEGINKKGFVVGLSQVLQDAFKSLPGSFILDGEAIGDDYHAFDLLERNGKDLRPLPYMERWRQLAALCLSSPLSSRIELVVTMFTMREKTGLWEQLRRENCEGIVFKKLDAPYTSGRPNSGGAQLKFKFIATLSAIVAKVNSQRSVELNLFKGKKLVSCGNVAIPANHDIPQVGAIVEVRYLYAFKESGILYQPVYLGRREDVEADECLVSQLKFKAD